MIPSEYSKLVALLSQRTDEGRVAWKEGSSPNEYEAQIGNNKIVIYRFEGMTPEGYEEDCVHFSIFKGFSRIDSFGASYSEGYSFTTLADLYSAARRKALGITDTIDEILTDLG